MQRWLRAGQPNCFLPHDRVGVDPFTQRFPVTLRCEGTVRGTGGIRLAQDDGSTRVPGLYAAGDAASREGLTGAASGGGAPNAAWAISSGSCNLCARACPTNVFEAREGEIPVIARPDDCQTCFMCELYCPVDALYVSPVAERHVEVDEQLLASSETLGAYARNMGWKGAKPQGADQDPTFRFRALQRAE